MNNALRIRLSSLQGYCDPALAPTLPLQLNCKRWGLGQSLRAPGAIAGSRINGFDLLLVVLIVLVGLEEPTYYQ